MTPFQQTKRVSDVALFEKGKPNHSRKTFEVATIQKHPSERICGREYPARESMPPLKAWGTSGWSYTELEDAKRKFRALVESRLEGDFQHAATPATSINKAERVKP